ncbi:MAG: sigma-70 family RNA polymerase sigma factor [Bdellovibrionaceae bacterium]|nr:sigma-70 family RNA polymerase sigma factor [Pseudobdellovibrionaceae bacterium]
MGKDLLILTDNELVQEIKTGNRKAFSEIVKRHQKSLLRMSLRFVKDLDMAEDVVQESFIKAFEKLNAFEGRASFKSWLFQIAVNTAKNKLRERRRATTDIDSVQLAVGAVAESSLVHSALSQEIQEEIDKLPTKQRTALILRVYEDLSFKEIADIMECPYDTAKANYRHALMKLKDSFEQKSDMSVSESFGGFYSEVAQYVEVE